MTAEQFEAEALRRRIADRGAELRGTHAYLGAAEIDRRARLQGCFPRGQRAELAEDVGLTTDGLKMIVQGHRRCGLETAIAICARFPRWLCLQDLVTIKRPISEEMQSISFLRIDIQPLPQAAKAA
jgi:hypothetical protein